MENWKNLMHLFVTIFLSNFSVLMVNPTIADVTMDAVCPGKDECSQSIYLTGLQQAIAGVASVIMMPLIGNLSDAYGRKLMLTFPLTLAIIPIAILAVKRTTNFFYIYYVAKIITATVTEGGSTCLALSYLADNVTEGKRVSAFGIFSGVISAATVCGTLTARLLPTDRIYQVAAVVAVVAAVYMRIFLEDDRPTSSKDDGLDQPILKPASEGGGTQPLKKINDLMKLPENTIRFLGSSTTVLLASSIAFFNSLAEAGVVAFLMYFLKARFHFQKDQFADICLITYATATFSSMVLVPLLGPFLGEETLVCIGLFAGFVNMLIDSIAWAPWVPYASAFLGVFLFLASPSIRCIISEKVGVYKQGIAQGCLMGITSLSNVASPLIFSPISAVFLSDDPPFDFPGFSILCIGLAYLAGFILSMVMKLQPLLSRNRAHNQPCLLA